MSPKIFIQKITKDSQPGEQDLEFTSAEINL